MNKRQRLAYVHDKTHVNIESLESEKSSALIHTCISTHSWNHELRCAICTDSVDTASALHNAIEKVTKSQPYLRASVQLSVLIDTPNMLAAVKLGKRVLQEIKVLVLTVGRNITDAFYWQD